MRIDLNQCDPKLRERIQRQLNQEAAAKGAPESVGRLEPTQREPGQTRALDRAPSPRQSRKRRVVVVVTFIAFVRRGSDEDNYGHGAYKPMRDAIARSVAVDDGDKRIKWEYAAVETRGYTGTQVIITLK